jgi:hypothetical protein
MCRSRKRTALAVCLTIGAALVILPSAARADRDSSREGRDRGHSRWAHARRHEPSSSREQARESHRRGSFQAKDGRRSHWGHHLIARGARKHQGYRGHQGRGGGQERGREQATAHGRGGKGHHRFASHEHRGGSGHHGWTMAHRGRSGTHARGAVHHRGRTHQGTRRSDNREESHDRYSGRADRRDS